jgi:CRISPR/Cas system CSM-associated protein Csm3 (group 7 of RAMP superfamily)
LDASTVVIQVRDGVVIDRDSHTAAEGLKYDYETVVAGTKFRIFFDLENPTLADEALFGAALFEWADGSTLGGFTSRGLGRFHLEKIEIFGVDMENPEERVRYLTSPDPARRWTNRGSWESYFGEKIQQHLQTKQ